MEVLLSRVTQQAVQYAIRSTVSITTGYAIKECGRLLKQAPQGKEREEIMQLQQRLDSKIRVISPSIDMIELIAARGNTSLESALSLTKHLRYEIQKLGLRLSNAANEEQLLRQNSSRANSREETDRELRAIIANMKLLLASIEDSIPLISLAITTSGVNLSTKLSGSVSPSRLLQASTFLSSADALYKNDPMNRQQLGPTYVLTLYMLFAGHAKEDGVRQATWKEVIHKARVKLWRVPLEQLYALPGETPDADLHSSTTMPATFKAGEFAYQLVIVEDLDDDRFHDDDDKTVPLGSFDGIPKAGIRDVIPIHEISKVFYADTGKILNIGGDGDPSNPVLLLKRDVHAEPPRRMLRPSESRARQRHSLSALTTDELDDQSAIDAQFERESAPPTPRKETQHPQDQWRLPPDLDPEWLAFEVYTEEVDSESEFEDQSRPSSSRSEPLDANLACRLAYLNLQPSSSPVSGETSQLVPMHPALLELSPSKRAGPAVKTSLSLLEMLMKLAALQQFRQQSHLAIEDELLNFFLEDSATAGAGADREYRQRLRHNAAKRVGFDPYDESPIKRRTETYIRQANEKSMLQDSPRSDGHQGETAYDDAYEHIVPLQQSFPRLDPSSLSPPRRMPYQQTPSPSSTPGITSESHLDVVRTKYGSTSRSSPQEPVLATPPSTSSQTRSALSRRLSGPKPRSPLHEVANDGE